MNRVSRRAPRLASLQLTLLLAAREDLGRAAPGGGEGVNLAEPEGELATHPRALLAVDGLEMLLPFSSSPESSRKFCVPVLGAWGVLEPVI